MGHYSTRLAISVLVIYIAYMGSAYFTQKLLLCPHAASGTPTRTFR